jgi:hypothetical protein
MLGLGIDLFQRGAGGAAVTQLFKAVTDTGANIKATAEAVFGKSLVWIKDINNSNNHQLIDTVRGTGVLQSNTTATETTYSAPSGTSVAWVFNAGGAAVTNTDGSVNSQVSANVDAGFSVVEFNPNLTSGQSCTVGHGLSQAPELIITKSRTNVLNWFTWTTAIDGSLDVLRLNQTNAKSDDTVTPASPTATVFSQNYGYTSTSTSIIAYCFHSVEGFIKIGTYSGTGADQAITGVGFQPSVVIAKRTDSTSNWVIADDVRLTSGESNFLYPNLTNAQSASAVITMESDGFSMDGGGADYNASGGTYLYIAIKGVD